MDNTNTALSTRATYTDLNTATTTLNNSISTKANSADVYNKTTVDGLVIARVLNSDFNNYKTTVSTALGEKVSNANLATYQNQVTANLAGKSNSADVYLKTATYSKSETDSLLGSKQNTFSNAANLSAIDQGLSTTSSPTFMNVTSNAPSQNEHLATKAYVDSQASASVVAGTGLTKTGSTLSVNATQSQITSVGTLTSLNVSGSSSLNQISANQISIPYNTNEHYISGFRFISTGVGNGNYLQSHTARTTGSFEPLHICDHGGSSVKLSILADKINMPLTTGSASITSGALTVAGGVGIAKDLFVGGNGYLVNSIASSNSPNLFLNNTAGGSGNAVSINLNPNSQRTGGSAVILSGVDNGNTDGYFSVRVATGSTSAVATQILKATSSSVQVNGSLSANSFTSSGVITGTSGLYSTLLNAPMIGVNVMPSTYPLHVLSSVATNVNLLRLAMPNLGTTSPISSSFVYGCDAFGVGDITGKISFIRTNSAANGRVDMAFSTSPGRSPGTDTTIERMRINSTGEVSIFSTIDAYSPLSGALQVSGGVSIGKNLNVGGNMYITNTDNATGDNTGALQVQGGINCAGNSYFRSGISSPSVSFLSLGPTRDYTGAITTSFWPGGTNLTHDFCLQFSSVKAGHFRFMNGSSHVFQITPTVSTFTSKVEASNYSSGTIENATTQAGVTMTKTGDFVYWSKTGRIVECYINLQLSAISGSQTGPLIFTLPTSCNASFTMDNVQFITRNGAQQTNMRLNFTANNNTVTLTVNNGFGAFIPTTPSASDAWHLMFNYPANSG